MNKKKLSLKKKTISTMSEIEQRLVKGGNAAYTTSFTNCTHFICCGNTCSPGGSVIDTSCLPNSYQVSQCPAFTYNC